MLAYIGTHCPVRAIITTGAQKTTFEPFTMSFGLNHSRSCQLFRAPLHLSQSEIDEWKGQPAPINRGQMDQHLSQSSTCNLSSVGHSSRKASTHPSSCAHSSCWHSLPSPSPPSRATAVSHPFLTSLYQKGGYSQTASGGDYGTGEERYPLESRLSFHQV